MSSVVLNTASVSDSAASGADVKLRSGSCAGRLNGNYPFAAVYVIGSGCCLGYLRYRSYQYKHNGKHENKNVFYCLFHGESPFVFFSDNSQLYNYGR